MKKIQYLVAFLICFSQNQFAQETKKEQIKAAKVAFITNELNLTSLEAEKFWPIFNAFDDKQIELRKNKIKSFRDRKEVDINKISEKEATEIVTEMEKNEEELYLLRKKFIGNLKGVIPSTKILKLKKAEEEFSRKLLRQYKQKRD
jgi:hypothetical protein